MIIRSYPVSGILMGDTERLERYPDKGENLGKLNIMRDKYLKWH